MITTVMFDMGGTLEDIFVDAQSEREAIASLSRILARIGLDPRLSIEDLKARVDAGWARYAAFRDQTNIERKPAVIWCDYVLSDFGFPREILEPHCEEIAHMWEVTHFHRTLRPRVGEMLAGLQAMGLKLGIISNTAALFQVFDSLREYEIRDYFQNVTLSSIVEMRKPSPLIFQVALHQLQARPEEAVYVGDTLSRDIIGAKRAGLAAAIQIGSQLTKEKDTGVTGEIRPDYAITDIYEVLPILRRLTEV